MGNEPILVTIHYQDTWGGGASSGNGGIQGGTDDTLETLKAHLAKYIPGAIFIKADCYDEHGKYLHSYESEAEAGEPIRAALLLEAGWEREITEHPLTTAYKKYFYGDGAFGCEGFIRVVISRHQKQITPSVYLVTADDDDYDNDVQIPFKKIKTMEKLRQLIEMLGE